MFIHTKHSLYSQYGLSAISRVSAIATPALLAKAARDRFWAHLLSEAPRPILGPSRGGPPTLIRAAAAAMTSNYVVDSDDDAELRSASAPIGVEQHLRAAHLFGPPRPLRWAMANSARATKHGARPLTT